MADMPSNFEEALAELAKIVQLLERGQPTLDESLSEFERGVKLLQFCRTQLESADRRILELVDIDDQGRATLKPFVHQATADKAETSVPSKKPKKPAKEAPTPTSPDEPDLFGS